VQEKFQLRGDKTVSDWKLDRLENDDPEVEQKARNCIDDFILEKDLDKIAE
jgi:hypothetical protein